MYFNLSKTVWNFVLDVSPPNNVVATLNKINPTSSINVTFVKPNVKILHFKVVAKATQDNSEVLNETDKSSCRFENLLPGEDYTICVASVNGSYESEMVAANSSIVTGI